MYSPTLSVIIVNYCHWDDTTSLIHQLRRSEAIQRGQSEIVLVDNHSPPHPVLPQLRRLGGVSVRRWSRNFGFARAVNEGARLSQGQWFLLLNPDITCQEDVLQQSLALTREFDGEKRVGIIGLNVRNRDGSLQHTTGPTPTFFSTLWRRMLPRTQRKYYHSVSDTQRQSVDWVSGCALLIHRDCFEQLQGLDSRFFLYYEDVDFCIRAREFGWEVLRDPSISVTHHHPLSSRKVSPWMHLLTRYALMVFGHKHWPQWQTLALCRLVQLETMTQRSSSLSRQLQALTHEIRTGQMSVAQRRLERLVRLENEHRHRRVEQILPAPIPVLNSPSTEPKVV